MPETFYELDEVPPGKPVTVSRSHSDSKKRERVLSAFGQIKEGASEEEIEKLRVSCEHRPSKRCCCIFVVVVVFLFCLLRILVDYMYFRKSEEVKILYYQNSFTLCRRSVNESSVATTSLCCHSKFCCKSKDLC